MNINTEIIKYHYQILQNILVILLKIKVVLFNKLRIKISCNYLI
jgi:hypothetical protein